MAKYVDGFVFPIPKKNMAAYRKMAKIGRKTWMKHGALDYIESTLNDSPKKTQMGPGFAKMMKAKPSETVVFAFITFKSKAHRNAVNNQRISRPGHQTGSGDTKLLDRSGHRCLGSSEGGRLNTLVDEKNLRSFIDNRIYERVGYDLDERFKRSDSPFAQ